MANKNALVYYNRGLTYIGRGDFDQAISDYTKAIELDPNLAEAYVSRGIVHARKSNLDKAISDYTKAIEINREYAYAYVSRGLIRSEPTPDSRTRVPGARSASIRIGPMSFG